MNLEPDETAASLQLRAKPRYLRTNIPALYSEMPLGGGITVNDIVEVAGDRKGVLEILYEVCAWTIAPSMLGGRESVVHYVDLSMGFSITRMRDFLLSIYRRSESQLEIGERSFLHVCLERMHIYNCNTSTQIEDIFNKIRDHAAAQDKNIDTLILNDINYAYWLHRATHNQFHYSRLIRSVCDSNRMIAFVGKSLVHGKNTKSLMYRVDDMYEERIRYRLLVEETENENDTYSVYFRRSANAQSKPYVFGSIIGEGITWNYY